MSRPRKGGVRRGPGPGAGSFRIIAGRWRGRRLGFPARPGVRPTGDRVRETLFNWLQPVIQGARCLDLFAGSGALGLEALSRGAERVVFVDADRECVTAIGRHLERLDGSGADLIVADALEWLDGPGQGFDVVFLDPPFEADLLSAACEALAGGRWLAPGALVYLEHAAGQPVPNLPEGWWLARSARAGAVSYHLAATADGDRS